jgi:hypothetical protein
MYSLLTVFCVLFNFNTLFGINTKTRKPYFLKILPTRTEHNKGKCCLGCDTVYSAKRLQ